MPIAVAPGSRVTTTSWPLARIQSASASTWVDLPAPSPPSTTMKKPLPAGAWAGSAPVSASRRSRRSDTPCRSSRVPRTSAATGSSSAPTSMSVNAAPPWSKVYEATSSRCGPIAPATTGAATAASATATRTTACRCPVVRARRGSSASWSIRVWPVLAATPAAYPAIRASSATVVASSTSPASSSPSPVTAMASPSSRRRDSPGRRCAALRMPSTGPPVNARTSRANSTGPPPRSPACRTVSATAAAIAPATAAQARTRVGSAPVRPRSAPAGPFGSRSPSSGECARRAAEPGSSRKDSVATEAANSPAATYDDRAAWW